MFGRDFWRQIENMSYTQGGSNIQQLEQSTRMLVVVLREFVNALAVPQKLWRTVQAQVLDSNLPLDQAPTGSTWTKRYWLTQQFGFNVIHTATQQLTLAQLANLAETDEAGNLVLKYGKPVYPFRSLDPATLGDLAGKTIDELTWMEAPKPVEPQPAPGPTP